MFGNVVNVSIFANTLALNGIIRSKKFSDDYIAISTDEQNYPFEAVPVTKTRKCDIKVSH